MKSFLTGRKALDSQALKGPHVHHATLQTTGAIRPAPTGPNVEVIKQGDKVVRLVVHCSCGEKIEVDCLYPAGS